MVKFSDVAVGDRLIYVGVDRSCYRHGDIYEIVSGPPHPEDECTLLLPCFHSGDRISEFHSVSHELERKGAWQLDSGPW